ncbi:hypothetical protein Leryth_010252 [Lithospermum erythrorhizon]|nr:hypothetical protein Leryth_010252 [Lithospermum erythrorhizon]
MIIESFSQLKMRSNSVMLNSSPASLKTIFPANYVPFLFSQKIETATQQGSGKVGKWKINFMSTQKWENPLMGWTSTGDPYANVGDSALSFDSEESAKEFAERHGWDYKVWPSISCFGVKRFSCE